MQEIAIGGHREWIQIQTEGDRPREIQRDVGRHRERDREMLIDRDRERLIDGQRQRERERLT